MGKVPRKEDPGRAASVRLRGSMGKHGGPCGGFVFSFFISDLKEIGRAHV